MFYILVCGYLIIIINLIIIIIISHSMFSDQHWQKPFKKTWCHHCGWRWQEDCKPTGVLTHMTFASLETSYQSLENPVCVISSPMYSWISSMQREERIFRKVQHKLSRGGWERNDTGASLLPSVTRSFFHLLDIYQPHVAWDLRLQMSLEVSSREKGLGKIDSILHLLG